MLALLYLGTYPGGKTLGVLPPPTQIQTNTKRKGYRPIEDLHDEYKNQNADEFKAITHLRRERARWGETFESLGGDGI